MSIISIVVLKYLIPCILLNVKVLTGLSQALYLAGSLRIGIRES